MSHIFCPWLSLKKFFASNFLQAPSKLTFWTILVTIKLLTQFQLKIRATKLSKSAIFCLTWIPTTAWKVSKYRVISGLYFPIFRLTTEIYSVNLRIQSESRNIRTRNNSLFGHFSRSVLYRCFHWGSNPVSKDF